VICPSRYQLARYEAAEPKPLEVAPLARHIEGCARCRAVVNELADARAMLFGGDLERASERAAGNIVARAREIKRARRWPFGWIPAGLVPATAALVLGLIVFRAVPHSSPGLRESPTRTKGALVVEAYCKRGTEVSRLQSGAEVLAGDRLRFAYTKDEPGYLMVFGVDDTGEIFPYYQENVLGGLAVRAGKAMLPDSVEMDAHRGWERLFVLWSAQEVSPDLVRAAVVQGMESAGRDVRKVDRLSLGVEQVSYLLRRP